MSQDLPQWFARFRGCLEQGSADEVLICYLDDFLSWYAKLGSAIDQLVIANPNNYDKLFPQELAKDQAKARYRQLIRIFHPDRGVKHEAWLTFRAERVNNAYKLYSDKRRAFQAEPFITNSAPRNKPTATGVATPYRKPKVYKARKLHQLLGDPVKLQKRIIWSFSVVSALVVSMLIVSVFAS